MFDLGVHIFSKEKDVPEKMNRNSYRPLVKHGMNSINEKDRSEGRARFVFAKNDVGLNKKQ